MNDLSHCIPNLNEVFILISTCSRIPGGSDDAVDVLAGVGRDLPLSELCRRLLQAEGSVWPAHSRHQDSSR